jgi:hydrogenase-4 component E
MEAAFSRITMTAASAMLLLSLVVLWRRHAGAYITALRTQSIALAATGAIVASFGGAPELFFVSFMILIVKGWIVPSVLSAMEAKRQSARELHPLLNTETSLLVCGALVVAAYEISRPLAEVMNLPTRGGLPIALALVFVSLFIVVSRREVIAQIVGFLMLENGIALLALLGAYGVPLIVELGVFLDVLLGVLVMQAVVYQIHDTSAD